MDLRQRLTTRRWAWPLTLVGLLFLGAARPARADHGAISALLATLTAPGLPAAAGPSRRPLTWAEWARVQAVFPAWLVRAGLEFPGALAAQVQARGDVAQLHEAALRVLEHDRQWGPPPAAPAGLVAALLRPPDGHRRAVAHGASLGAGAEPRVEPSLRAGLTLDWHTPQASDQLPRPRPPRAREGLFVLRSPHDNSDVLWTLPETTLQELLASPGRLATISDSELRARLVPYWPGERADGRLVAWLGLALGPLACWTQLSNARVPGSAPGVSLAEPARLRLSALVASAQGSRHARQLGPACTLDLEPHDGNPRLGTPSVTATRLPPHPASVTPLRPSAEVIRTALTARDRDRRMYPDP